MKFGAQLRSKSVPEWRSYNIDYNDLKHRIRITTEKRGPARAKYAQDLHNAFIEQIDMVNLFLQSKVGEVKRRVIFVENLMEKIDRLETQSDTDSLLSKSYDELDDNLHRLTQDLQKLSRFIVLQKTGLRKLLKKYTKYSHDNGKLNMEINTYMIKNPQSFIYIDLSGFYVELALIYDLIRGKEHPEETRPTPSTARRTSYTNPMENLNLNESFDFNNAKNGTHRRIFLVHYDNITELRLLLLSHFQLIDESVRHERRSLQVQKQRSSYSFRQLIERRSSLEDITKKQEEERQKRIDAPPATAASNEIYLNSNDGSTDDQITVTYLDNPRHLQSLAMDSDPGMVLHDAKTTNRSLLIAAIGGLRKASNVLLNDDSFVEDLLKVCEAGEGFEEFVLRHADFISTLDSLERVSIDWLFSRGIKPMVKTTCNKSRFTLSTNEPVQQLQTWITLSSNIQFSTEDLTIPSWTSVNKEKHTNFPYAVLELRISTSSTNTSPQLPPTLQELMNSHLVYEVESTLNPLTYHLFQSSQLSFTPSWAQYFGDSPKDIHKNPPRQVRPKKSSIKSTSVYTSDGSATDVAKPQSVDSSKFRYWNEFDNGSEGEGDAAFYVDVDEDDGTFFSPATMEYFYKLANRVSSFFYEKMGLYEDDEHGKLVDPEAQFVYGSMDGRLRSIPESDLESGVDDDDDEAGLDPKDAHDLFRVFIALSTSALGLVLTSLSLGVSASLVGYGDISVNPVVILLLVVTFCASLCMSVVSIGFIMAVDQTQRKVWQTTFVWFSFFSITVLTVVGIITLFGL